MARARTYGPIHQLPPGDSWNNPPAWDLRRERKEAKEEIKDEEDRHEDEEDEEEKEDAVEKEDEVEKEE